MIGFVSLSWLIATGLAFQSAPVSKESERAPEAVRPLSPQDRGDIYMARKMYREAIETYMSAPSSALLLNKIGIAYHQLVDLDSAAKYYARAVKADPKYSDAINNLGTIY